MTENEQWLQTVIPLHGRLTDVVAAIIRNLLEHNSIEYLSVTGRTKDVISISEKIERKKYKEPRAQLTDLTGIRIVTFLESQVQQIINVVKSTFDIDFKNSLDRSEILGSDKVGYRSAHFVCTLGDKRKELLEYKDLSALKFEVQIRTLLQHAWAELAHDGSFKFNPGLPKEIQRRLNLYSGMLEIVDAGFDVISKEIDVYVKTIDSLSNKENEKNEIDRVSLQKFVNDVSARYKLKVERNATGAVNKDILDELVHFGAKRIGDVARLVTEEFIRTFRIAGRTTTSIGLLRDLMMYTDIEKYFTGPVHWTRTDEDSIDILYQKWGREKVIKLMLENHIEIMEKDEHIDPGPVDNDF